MRVYFLISGAVFFLFSIIYPVHADKKCYEAKICVHDGKEKCGRDGDGHFRRFLDSCDIKEYNCLRRAEYTKVNNNDCSDLPSIDEQVSKETLHKKVTKEEVTAEDEHQDLGPGGGNQVTSESAESHQITVKEQTTKATTTKTTTTKATTTIEPIDPRKSAVINEYWCWRARYCKEDRKVVCGRDRRLRQKMKYASECHIYKHNCDFETVLFYHVSTCLSLSNHHPLPKDSPEIREKFAEFHCFKLKTCTEGGDPVCGYDDTEMYLAEFEDLCTLHRVNCHKRGLFTHIDDSICAGQKKFQASEGWASLEKQLN